jgi:COP9 signalosome complex subunit 7
MDQETNIDVANASALPSLNEKQLEKLKQLSLITIASRGSQYLTYSSLLQELDLSSVRALEDLVISAIYADLLHAKLDTKSQFVEVSSTAGRDVAPTEIPSMIETLTRWCGQCEDVLADIDAQMKAVHDEAVQKKKESDEYEKLLAHKREQLRNEEKTSGALSKGKRVISEGDDGTRGGYDDDEMDVDDSPVGADGHGHWGGANTSRRRTKGRFGGLMPGGPHKRR